MNQPHHNTPSQLTKRLTTPDPSKLRSLHEPSLTWRNRAYNTAPCQLRSGHTLVWQHTPVLHPAGELRCTLGEFEFSVAANHLWALERRLQGFESFVPSHACTALVEHALSPVLDFLESLSGQTIACQEFAKPPPKVNETSTIQIGFSLHSAKEATPTVQGWVRAPENFWQRLNFSQTNTLALHRVQNLPLQISVQLGACQISAEAARQLQVGDAFRTHCKKNSTPDTELLIQLIDIDHQFGCQATLNVEKITLQTPMELLMETPVTENPLSLINQLDIDIRFEIGRIRLSLAEVSALRTGHSLRLGTRLHEQPVRILANGQAIAQGELATLGDELVVVLTNTQGLGDVKPAT
jgi:type III secretion system YscQ/HrcQ family protein